MHRWGQPTCEVCGLLLTQFGPDSSQAELNRVFGPTVGICRACQVARLVSQGLRQLDRASSLVAEVLLWLHGLFLVLLAVNSYVAERRERESADRVWQTDRPPSSDDEDELLRQTDLP